MDLTVKQEILNALISGYGMTAEEAECSVVGCDEIDGGIGGELLEELTGGEYTEFEVDNLSLCGHAYTLNISVGDGLYQVLLLFHGTPRVEVADEELERFESSSAAEQLTVENEIEGEEDALILNYEFGDGLCEGLIRLFELLNSEECRRLADTLLTE